VMNYTEELREELLTILCGLCDPPDQDGFGDTHFIERRENVISEILSLLHKKNYQKVIDIPGQAKLEGKTWEFCEPIDIGGKE